MWAAAVALKTNPSSGLSFPLFGPLDQEDSELLAPVLRRRKFAPRQVVFQRGDIADEVYHVISGRLQVSVFSSDGRELAFRIAGPGSIVGEIGVIDLGCRTADVVAAAPTEVTALRRSDLESLLIHRPSLAVRMSRFLCERLRETSEQLEAQALQRIEERLARLLIRLLPATGANQKDIELPLIFSQSDAASLIGASRPKVNAAFCSLEARGAIRRKGKMLVCDPSALRMIANVEDG